MSTTYKYVKTNMPFEGKKWLIVDAENRMSSPFGMYNTKKDAKNDAKEFGLRMVGQEEL